MAPRSFKITTLFIVHIPMLASKMDHPMSIFSHCSCVKYAVVLEWSWLSMPFFCYRCFSNTLEHTIANFFSIEFSSKLSLSPELLDFS